MPSAHDIFVDHPALGRLNSRVEAAQRRIRQEGLKCVGTDAAAVLRALGYEVIELPVMDMQVHDEVRYTTGLYTKVDDLLLAVANTTTLDGVLLAGFWRRLTDEQKAAACTLFLCNKRDDADLFIEQSAREAQRGQL